MNRYSRITVSDIEPFRPRLVVEIFSTIYHPAAYLFQVPLVYVATHEVGLDDGRFINFWPETRTHLVGEKILYPWISVEDLFASRLAWIQDNVRSEWSFDLSMDNVHEGRFLWSFEDDAEALLFRLTF